MIFELDLTLSDGADPLLVADMILTLLFNQPEDGLPGVETIDGCLPLGPS